MKVNIDDIIIGKRFRKELGNIDLLAASIAEIGLLHPIVVTPDNRLIAGRRRIEAYKLLGRTQIEASVIDLEEITRGEFAENEIRKDFTWSERVEIAKELEPEERAAARDRQGSLNHPELVASEKFTEAGEALDKVAQAVGTSRPTLTKAMEIYDSGDEELIAEMDQTGKVSGTYHKLQRRQRQAVPAPALPAGKYNLLLADPPWCYGDKLIDGYGSAEHHYLSMTIPELCILPVKNLVADDAVLFLWVTSPLLEECFAVIKAWGFEYKASFVWDKVRHNFGHYNSVRHELLLVCTRGSFLPQTTQLYDSVVSVERSGRHSEKPTIFREMIEALYPSTERIELFARAPAEGWDIWGNEI